ncbi:MAG: dihydropteroate synthase [Candidatus Saccharibacteria bacterium]
MLDKDVQIVGILNITPDSFSDGGQYFDSATATLQADKLFVDGASIVDVGAESTRPNAIKLTADEEWQRLQPVLEVLIPKYTGKISLDTYHPETVRRALAIGPIIVNDVTGMNNPDMVDVVAELKPTVIISHLPDMDIQTAHQTMPISDINQVKDDLLAKAQQLIDRGLPKSQIVLDPGIGFGKTPEVNVQLLKFAGLVPDYDVMIGYSRKRFLGEDRMELAPNLDAGRIAIKSGAKYLRVHDVAGHTQIIK